MFPIPFRFHTAPPAIGIGTLEPLGAAVMAIGMATVPVDFGRVQPMGRWLTGQVDGLARIPG